MWKTNEVKPLTVIAPDDKSFKAYYKIRESSVDFTEISGDFEYKGNDVWELLCSFDTGDYMIRFNEMNEGKVMYLALQVGQTVAEEVCGCVSESTTNMATKIDDVAADTRQVLLNLGDEINENQAIIEAKDGSRMLL